MASYTTNLNLKKPAGSENVAIGDINGNMDIIDTAYGALNPRGTSVLLKSVGTNTSDTLSDAITNYRFIMLNVYANGTWWTTIIPIGAITTGSSPSVHAVLCISPRASGEVTQAQFYSDLATELKVSFPSATSVAVEHIYTNANFRGQLYINGIK
jgi:hypothetical protein